RLARLGHRDAPRRLRGGAHEGREDVGRAGVTLPRRRRTELAQQSAVGDGLVEAKVQRGQRLMRPVVLTGLQRAELHRRDVRRRVLGRGFYLLGPAALLRRRLAEVAACRAQRGEHLVLGASTQLEEQEWIAIE